MLVEREPNLLSSIVTRSKYSPLVPSFGFDLRSSMETDLLWSVKWWVLVKDGTDAR